MEFNQINGKAVTRVPNHSHTYRIDEAWLHSKQGRCLDSQVCEGTCVAGRVQVRSVHRLHTGRNTAGACKQSFRKDCHERELASMEMVAGFNTRDIKEHQRSWPRGLQGELWAG